MSESINEMTNCPNCPNHCPKDNLRCGRGRAFFAQDGASDESKPDAEGQREHRRGNMHGHGGMHEHGFAESESRNPLVQTLTKAAAVAEHKSRMMREHGRDENEMFSALSPEEQQTLSTLLNKQLDVWAKDHAAHHH